MLKYYFKEWITHREMEQRRKEIPELGKFKTKEEKVLFNDKDTWELAKDHLMSFLSERDRTSWKDILFFAHSVIWNNTQPKRRERLIVFDDGDIWIGNPLHVTHSMILSYLIVTNRKHIDIKEFRGWPEQVVPSFICVQMGNNEQYAAMAESYNGNSFNKILKTPGKFKHAQSVLGKYNIILLPGPMFALKDEDIEKFQYRRNRE